MEPNVKKINRWKVILELMSRQKDHKFFSVKFIKKDNTVRTMLGQFRPPKPNPKRESPAKKDNPFILVGDVLKYQELLRQGKTKEEAYDGSYRMLSLETVFEIHMDGQTFVVED